MKRPIAFLLAMALCAPAMPVFAADTAASPADIDAAAYTYLMEHSSWTLDTDKDKVISESELAEATHVFLELTDVQDITWLKKLKKCYQLNLTGGTFTDFSVLADMPALSFLQMDNIPVTDLAFLDGLNLESCFLENMPQITEEMRAEKTKFPDLTLTAGTDAVLSYYPRGLAEVTLMIADNEIAQFFGTGITTRGNDGRVYGLKAGETTYSVSVGDKVIAEKKITVKEAPAAFDPALQDRQTGEFSMQQSYYYNPDPKTGNSGSAALIDGTLYTFRGSRITAAETGVKQYECVDLRSSGGKYISGDIVLKENGTVLVNGEKMIPEKCKEICKQYAIGESGKLYGLIPLETGFQLSTPVSDAAYFVPDCPGLYVTASGSVRHYSYNSTSAKIFIENTNIGAPAQSAASDQKYYLLDKSGTLYLLDFSKSPFEKSVVAKQVADVYWTDINTLEYKSLDGTVTLLEQVHYIMLGLNMHWGALNLDASSFYLHELQADGIEETAAVISYFIDRKHELRFRFLDDTPGLTHVKAGICSTYDAETKSGLLWFLREDGSIWYYDLQKKEWHDAVQPTAEHVAGDLNGDGVLTAADAVLLCRYLSCDAAALPNWHNADLDKNGILTASDLTLLKRLLMK